MELLNIIIILLLIVSLVCWYYSIYYRQCPSPKIVYNDPVIPLDIQFGTTNFPSDLYDNLFTGPNVFMGGYSIDQGRSVPPSQNFSRN